MLQPAVIDGLAFVRAAGVLKGRLGIELLPRLAQSGCSGSLIDFALTGGVNERGKPELRLAVDGSVRLQCQRCLEEMDFPLRFEAQLELVASEDEILAAGDEVEQTVATRDMDVAVLVEDEIILALPMVPKHEQCSAAEGSDGETKPSAFQALAALKN